MTGTTRINSMGKLSKKPAKKRNSGGSPKKPGRVGDGPAYSGSGVVFRKSVPVGQSEQRHKDSSLYIGGGVTKPGTEHARARHVGQDRFLDLDTTRDRPVSKSPQLRSVRMKTTDTVELPGEDPTTYDVKRGEHTMDVSQLKPGEFMVHDPNKRTVPKRPVGGGAAAPPPGKESVANNAYKDYEARIARNARIMGMGVKDATEEDINPDTGKRYTHDEIMPEKRKGLIHRTQYGTMHDRKKAEAALAKLDEGEKRYQKERDKAKKAAEAAAKRDAGPRTMKGPNGQQFFWSGSDEDGSWRPYSPPGSRDQDKTTDFDKAASFKDFSRFFDVEDGVLDAFQKKAVIDAITRGVPYAQIAEQLGIERVGEWQVQESQEKLLALQNELTELENIGPIKSKFNRTGRESRKAELRKEIEAAKAEFDEWNYRRNVDLSTANYFKGASGISHEDMDSNQDGKLDETDEFIAAMLDVVESPDGHSQQEIIYAKAAVAAYEAQVKAQAQADLAGRQA